MTTHGETHMDIVDVLRSDCVDWQDCEQAAAEIESLRTRLAKMESHYSFGDFTVKE